MRIRSKFMLVALATSLAMVPNAASAVDTTPEPAPLPDITAGKRAIEARNWNAAIKSLTAAAQREPRNADVQNLLGYAYRNTGQMEAALRHYQRALQIDPRHLGAHEYIGEAYLMANDLAKAEEHLAALKRFCPGVCVERDDLSTKIAAYRAQAK
jgi:Flp pilus assembly protein TadD